jgi:hypothetical protein
MLQSLERCAVQQEELHSLQWENRTRVQEVQELQKVRDVQLVYCGATYCSYALNETMVNAAGIERRSQLPV